MTLEMTAVVLVVFVGVFAIGVTIGRILERRSIEVLNKIDTDYSGAI